MKNRHYRAQSKSRTPRWIALAALVILVVIVGGGYLVHHRPKDSASVAGIGAPVSAAMMKDLTAIPSSVWKGLGTKGAVAAQLTPNKPTPSFLYIGAEGCPYCAAERWPIVVALSRFGHFSGLTLMRSNGQDSYPNTPTVDFLHARFRSPYFTAHLMEILGRKLRQQCHPVSNEPRPPKQANRHPNPGRFGTRKYAFTVNKPVAAANERNLRIIVQEGKV